MNAELAKSQAELNLKAIAAVSASSAKLAVQPATLNGGVSGLAPSPGDAIVWIEDIRTRNMYITVIVQWYSKWYSGICGRTDT